MTTFHVYQNSRKQITITPYDNLSYGTIEQALDAVRQMLEARSVDPKFTPGNVLRFVSEGRRTSLVKVEEILDAKYFRGIDLLGTVMRAGTSYSGWIIPGLQGEWEVV